jgi:hypothetical protein
VTFCPSAALCRDANGRPACSYCGFCQGFGCHIGAKSSILVTKLPDADATGNFKLITGAMCYRVNSDNSGRVTGVSYYGPVIDKSKCEDGTFSREDFTFDKERDVCICPAGNVIATTGNPVSDGETLL